MDAPRNGVLIAYRPGCRSAPLRAPVLVTRMPLENLPFPGTVVRKGGVVLPTKPERHMIKNFSYTIPTVGRIAIGETRECNGRRLPGKLNHFIITAQHKREGKWVNHPITDVVASESGQSKEAITEIPVALMFNDPDLSVRERYEAFDNEGRMLCAGDGEFARRVVNDKVETVDCPGADHCPFAKTARCKLMTRLNVQINVQDAEKKVRIDPMSSFILRSSGFNTARTLHSKIKFFHAMLGGKLVGVPFRLKLRQKSSSKSRQSIFFYVDLVLDCSLADAAQVARETADTMAGLGLDQTAFEDAVRNGLSNGAFEDTTEDLAEFEEYLGSDFLEEPTGDGETDAGLDGAPEGRDEQPQMAGDFGGLDALREMMHAKAAA